jgi:hypothetical protein
LIFLDETKTIGLSVDEDSRSGGRKTVGSRIRFASPPPPASFDGSVTESIATESIVENLPDSH